MARNRSMLSALGRLLSDSPSPVYVLNDKREIVYANKSFFQWTGSDEETLIGVRCDYHSSPEVGAAREIAARLCPPAEVFRGEAKSAEIASHQKSGKQSHRRAHFTPLAADELDFVGVIAIVETIDLSQEIGEPVESINPTPDELHQRLLALRERVVPRYGIDRLVGNSIIARRIRRQVGFAHQSRAHTVIHGPSGSGREHVARTIHYGDQPSLAGRLVPVACPLMDAELLQATIANVIRHTDELDSTAAPVLLLLDVDQLSETAQYELAGFFSIPEFELFTLSTSRYDLLRLAEERSFRGDLASSLSTLVVHLPPLVERKDDIPALAQVFLEQFNSTGGRQLNGFSHEALDQLAAYNWPGNIDELAGMVHEACAQADEVLVNAWDLPQRIRYAADAAAYPRQSDDPIVMDDFLAEVEAELIRRALQKSKGNKTKAAELLGVTRHRLHRKLEQMSAEDGSDDE